MRRDEVNGARWNSYDQSFREDAHRLLAWGYNDSRPHVASDSEETEITGFLVEAMETKLSSPDLDERFDRYCIKEDNPVSGEGRTGKRRRRLDIVVECTYRPRHINRPKYVFEAKRLRRPGHLIGNYVGNEGVKRFVNAKYAADCPEVAMVGYFQSDAALYWIERLREQFDKARYEFKVREPLSKEIVISELPDEWRSGHLRTNGAPVAIYHILLDCTSAFKAP
ncbi:MAG: hypothetical protein CVU57_06430 [Deltaproteobacteria bacterium HGW-Deltaproteobacteria-15]|jgi:hypothetical protein|nr:MAG: hypothetical protein CVU57_06430 [Deltaproteobacteria bacterium HGW-Deltaproteobacteria-15]